MTGVILVVFFLWILPILICHSIGAGKNRSGTLWGVFLGWLGVPIVALLTPDARPELRALAAPEPAKLSREERERLEWQRKLNEQG